MNALVSIWIVLLFASFAITVLALSFVQVRLMGREGWRVFRAHSLVDLYWRKRTPIERLLIWPGLVAFFLTLLAGIVSTLVRNI